MLVLARASRRHAARRARHCDGRVGASHFEYHLDAALADAISLLGPPTAPIRYWTPAPARALRGICARRGWRLTVPMAQSAFRASRAASSSAPTTRPFARCRSHDWAVSLEVAEHIPRAAEATYLANLNCSAARGLVLSWAPPGQAGSGHVNTRPMAEVRELVGALGLVVDEAASAALRRAATLPWFKRNLIVPRRIDAGAEDARGVAGARADDGARRAAARAARVRPVGGRRGGGRRARRARRRSRRPDGGAGAIREAARGRRRDRNGGELTRRSTRSRPSSAGWRSTNLWIVKASL